MNYYHLLRKAVAAALLFCPFNTLHAQGSWTFAGPSAGAGTSGAETARDICADAAGNIYCVGTFNGNGSATNFDIINGGSSFTANNSQDGYIVSYDKNGNYRWKVIVSGGGSDFGAPGGGICTDGTSVWVAGSVTMNGFTPQIITPLATTNVTSAVASSTSQDVFIGKFNCSNGALQWHVSFGGTGSEQGQGICNDPDGNVYVTGCYTGGFTLDGVTAPAVAAAPQTDFFIAKFSPTGKMLHFSAGGVPATSDMIGSGGGVAYIQTTPPALVATGHIGAGAATFGSFTNVGGAGGLDALLLELDTTLNFTNALGFGGSGTDELTSVTYDPYSKGVYVSGYYTGSGFTMPGVTPALPSPTANDMIIARYSTAGNNFTWAKVPSTASGSGTNNDRAWDITADGKGGILVGGYFASSSITFGSTTLNNSGLNDAFVARYNVNGTPDWALKAGSVNTEEIRGIASYVQASPYTQILFTTGLTLAGGCSFGSFNVGNNGGNDFFVARLTDATAPPAPLPVTLGDFTATWKNTFVQIDWIVYTELDIDHYDVEKSGNGREFQQLATVPASGSNHSYCAFDNAPTKGNAWYRLKITGKNKVVSYSKMIKVSDETAASSNIYAFPNPADNVLHISAQSIEDGAIVTISDMTGRIVRRTLISAQQADVAMQEMTPGIYVLQLQHGNTVETVRVIKK